MPIFDRVDPEIARVLSHVPVVDISDIAVARESYNRMLALMGAAAQDPRVTTQDVIAPARADHPPVRLRLFRPVDTDENLPCVYWTQGGGYVLTNPTMDDAWCADLAARLHCAVISVDWRRAPEHPFPAASEDCYTGLKWSLEEAATLKIDPTRVVISGHSSGGGSTASLALLVRDRREFTVAHQILIYPMLDDTNSTPSSHLVTDPNVWNRASNDLAWKAYLGESWGTPKVSPYAAPMRMMDLEGSIPASILTGELDLFRDENVQYALRLMAANVPTELHVYPGAPHGFDRMAPKAKISQRFRADFDAICRRVFDAPSPGQTHSPSRDRRASN